MAADRFTRVHQVHADAQIENRLSGQHEIEVTALLEWPELPAAGAKGVVIGSVLALDALAAERKVLLSGGDKDVIEVDRAVALRVVKAELGMLDVVCFLPFRCRGIVPVVAQDVIGR